MDEIQKTASQVDTDKHMVLRTEGLVKRYGKRTVANGVTINVKQGEIVGLLGPNGAGKTTSFYMTTGLVVPNAGHVYLDDQDITGYPVYKRARAGIGYLPQEASVFRKMSVEDNILSVLEMTGKPREYQMEKLESLINDFDLQKVRKNLGDQLSGGERRRTEIARCLANDPKFIMLDEPFAGVDPIQVEEIQNIVWRLKYRNIGILITDHNVDETLAIMPTVFVAGGFALVAWATGNMNFASYLHIPYLRHAGELVIVCTAIVGAGLGFLWFNTYPAQVFMGDVGSLALGGALGIIAVLLRQEFLLVIMGGVFVVETLSVILQVGSFKLRGQRIFRMAPIHHHYELKGWPEPRVIVRFWIISLMLVLIGLATLKVR